MPLEIQLQRSIRKSSVGLSFIIRHHRLCCQLLNGKKQVRRSLSLLINAGTGQAHQLHCQLSPVNFFPVSGHQQTTHFGQPTGFIGKVVIRINIDFLTSCRGTEAKKKMSRTLPPYGLKDTGTKPSGDLIELSVKTGAFSSAEEALFMRVARGIRTDTVSMMPDHFRLRF